MFKRSAKPIISRRKLELLKCNFWQLTIQIAKLICAIHRGHSARREPSRGEGPNKTPWGNKINLILLNLATLKIEVTMRSSGNTTTTMTKHLLPIGKTWSLLSDKLFGYCKPLYKAYTNESLNSSSLLRASVIMARVILMITSPTINLVCTCRRQQMCQVFYDFGKGHVSLVSQCSLGLIVEFDQYQ